MNIKIIGLTLLLSVAAGAICFANPTAGTWKLNESKSKFGEGANKGETVVWSTVGDQEKVSGRRHRCEREENAHRVDR